MKILGKILVSGKIKIPEGEIHFDKLTKEQAEEKTQNLHDAQVREDLWLGIGVHYRTHVRRPKLYIRSVTRQKVDPDEGQ